MSAETTYIERLESENRYLKEQLDWFQRQLFGKKSEKVVADLNEQQLTFEDFDLPAPQEENVQKIEGHSRRTPSRKGHDKVSLPANLPVERKVIDLPESEKIDAEGKRLVKIGEEVSFKLNFQPGHYFIKETVRLKYAAIEGGEKTIKVADLPQSLLNRCQAGESLLAHILVQKFSDHLPLYRISEIFARDGIGISRQLLSKWVIRCGLALKPLYDEMTRNILQSGNVFIDETPISMLVQGKSKAHTAYMWVLCGGKSADPPYRVYDFRTSRQHKHARDLLVDYEGVLHSDKYGAYEALALEKKFIWCPCFVHIRRKFFDAISGDPKLRDWILRKIKHLFWLEKIAWSRPEEERLKVRKEKEEPILDELISAVKNRLTQGRILPKSKFKEALGYFCSLIPYLKNYLRQPYARIDNNVAERAVRPLAIGRKNWLFFGSEEGGQAAAVIFSLVQTCRGLKIDPRLYLEDVMRRLMSHPANKLYELLPDQWIKSSAGEA